MGAAISSTGELSTFSLVTGIIGIVSFSFTAGILIKVVWVNVTTLGEAPHQVHTYLTTLRTELLEERASLKSIRKGMKKHQRLCRQENRRDLSGMALNDVSLRTMDDSVRTLMKRFRDLEKPFLQPGEEGINHAARPRKRSGSISPYYKHAAYGSPRRKSRPRSRSNRRSNYAKEKDDSDGDDDAYWAQKIKYDDFTIVKRFRWLTHKSEAQSLFETLSRVQIRRVALQVGGLTMMMNLYVTETSQMQDTIQRIDESVSRPTRVRRPDT